MNIIFDQSRLDIASYILTDEIVDISVLNHVSCTVFFHIQSETVRTIKVHTAPYAKFCLVLHHQIGKNTHSHLQMFIEVQKEAECSLIIITTSEGQSTFQARLITKEEGAQGSLKNIFVGKQDAHGEVSFSAENLAPTTKTSLVNRGILFDNAELHLFGDPVIAHNAVGGSTYLEQKTLLVGDNTRVISEPLLSVAHNEVRATHSATVSSLQEEDAFYLESRGLTRLVSTSLFTEGFTEAVLHALPDTHLQDCLKEYVFAFTRGDEVPKTLVSCPTLAQ